MTLREELKYSLRRSHGIILDNLFLDSALSLIQKRIEETLTVIGNEKFNKWCNENHKFTSGECQTTAHYDICNWKAQLQFNLNQIKELFKVEA